MFEFFFWFNIFFGEKSLLLKSIFVKKAFFGEKINVLKKCLFIKFFLMTKQVLLVKKFFVRFADGTMHPAPCALHKNKQKKFQKRIYPLCIVIIEGFYDLKT